MRPTLSESQPNSRNQTSPVAAPTPTSACAVDGSLYGTRDLYVADGSLFPTSVGVNPMMTIIAFSKQVARGIAAAERSRSAAALV